MQKKPYRLHKATFLDRTLRRFILNPIRRTALRICLGVINFENIELEVDRTCRNEEFLPDQYHVGIRKKDGPWVMTIRAKVLKGAYKNPEKWPIYRIQLSKLRFYGNTFKQSWFHWWHDQP